MEQENVTQSSTDMEYTPKAPQSKQKLDVPNAVTDNTTRIPEPLQMEQQGGSPIHSVPRASLCTYVTPPMSPAPKEISDPTTGFPKTKRNYVTTILFLPGGEFEQPSGVRTQRNRLIHIVYKPC